MGYARIDDSFWMNEKVDGLSDKAFRLYVRGISFASALNTDGVITKRQLRVLEGAPKVVAELVAARAWDVIEDGWQIHNYTVHNASAEERRARASNAASKRWRKQPASPSTPEPDAKAMLLASETHANGMQPASIEQCQNDAYTTQLISTQSKDKATTTHLQPLPMPLAPPGGEIPTPLRRAFDAAERLHGTGFSARQYEIVSSWCEEFEPVWVQEACEIGVLNNAGSLAYARSVLDGWKKNGKPAPENRSKSYGNRNGKPVAITDGDETNEQLTARLEQRSLRRLGILPMPDVSGQDAG